uniref:Transmembrane protein n=1 Tax=Triticum urartu TaxID=4572 RepID=A0A8R7UMX3_TRIUA
MGRLRKVSRKYVPLVSSVESANSLRDPFVPNDFADDGSNAMSLGVIICLLIFFPFSFSFFFYIFIFLLIFLLFSDILFSFCRVVLVMMKSLIKHFTISI